MSRCRVLKHLKRFRYFAVMVRVSPYGAYKGGPLSDGWFCHHKCYRCGEYTYVADQVCLNYHCPRNWQARFDDNRSWFDESVARSIGRSWQPPMLADHPYHDADATQAEKAKVEKAETASAESLSSDGLESADVRSVNDTIRIIDDDKHNDHKHNDDTPDDGKHDGLGDPASTTVQHNGGKHNDDEQDDKHDGHDKSASTSTTIKHNDNKRKGHDARAAAFLVGKELSGNSPRWKVLLHCYNSVVKVHARQSDTRATI